MLSGSNAEVTVYTRSESADASGSRVTKWAATAYNAACYIQTNSGSENAGTGAERTDFRGVARFPAYISVGQGDRIVWGGRTLQVDACHAVYRVADWVDYYHVEWSGATNAGR